MPQVRISQCPQHITGFFYELHHITKADQHHENKRLHFAISSITFSFFSLAQFCRITVCPVEHLYSDSQCCYRYQVICLQMQHFIG